MMTNAETKGTVLVVDDDPLNLRMCRRCLERENYKVLIAADGLECMEVARSGKPSLDLIILDATMPKMDGFETLKQLKADPELAAVPIIMLTAHTSSEDVVRAFDLGSDDYIRKPFIVKELLARIKKVSKRQQLALLPQA